MHNASCSIRCIRDGQLSPARRGAARRSGLRLSLYSSFEEREGVKSDQKVDVERNALFFRMGEPRCLVFERSTEIMEWAGLPTDPVDFRNVIDC